jgi:hypothetical protein
LEKSNPGFTLEVYQKIYGNELEDVLTLADLGKPKDAKG